MNMPELESWYETALRPAFGERLCVVHERDDFAHVLLDGDREEFFFTLYGPGHLRLYWCNQCFIFDSRRDSLVSSDTFGEIIFEGEVNAEKLPPILVALVLRLKDAVFLDKKEWVTGKIPSGYDERKGYHIRAQTPVPRAPFRLANIWIEFVALR